MTMILNTPVLVLNQNYQPLNICNVRRAMVLLGVGKAELLANGRGDIHTVRESYTIPSVIRLYYMVRKPVMQRKLSRRGDLSPRRASPANTAACKGRT